MKFFAHKSYISKNGAPTTVEQMSNHRLICQGPESPQVSAGARWVESFLNSNNSSVMLVNNYYGILQAVLHGFGVGVLPDYLVIDFPELIPILPNSESDPVPVFLAYPEELRHSKRVKAFRDFIIEEMAEDKIKGSRQRNQKKLDEIKH